MIIAIFLAVLVRLVLFQAFSIPSGSMSPTLESGDTILVARYALLPHHAPARGDVVVFHSVAGADRYLVKRIVGLPGDYVEGVDGRIRINGTTLAEPYLPAGESTAAFPPEIVPGGHYFVLGDNRSNSLDSRKWGFVPDRKIVGKALLVFWSTAADSGSPAASASVAVEKPREPHSRWFRILRLIR